MSPVVVDSHGSVTTIVKECYGLPTVRPPGVFANIVMVCVPASAGKIDVNSNDGVSACDVKESVVMAVPLSVKAYE